MKIIPGLFLILLFTFAAAGQERAKIDRSGAKHSAYVKIEVKGKLVVKGNGYAIESADTIFPSVKLIVMLERSEDKNRHLTSYLESLKDKTVIAEGNLDCRRIGAEQQIIYLELGSESQIKETRVD